MAPRTLETPHTTTAVNQNSPKIGLKVVVSQFWLAWVSRAPPMPAMADDTQNTNSLARRKPMPTAWAAVSESRMAASTRPSRPLRRLWASTSTRPTTTSSKK